jgi:hypothetical protein
LVLVATSKNASALATIALAVAIFAFLIQIMVFVADLLSRGLQTARNEELYARMTGLLEGLRSATQGTQQTLEKHVDTLLRAATGAASEVVAESNAKTKFDPAEFEERVLARARRVAQEETGVLRDAEARAVAREAAARRARERRLARQRSISSEDREIVTRLITPPSEDEAPAANEIFRSLSPAAVKELGDLREDDITSRRSGTFVGLWRRVDDPEIAELQAKGLAEQVDEPDDEGDVITRLTPAGREVARLFAAGDGPARS